MAGMDDHKLIRANVWMHTPGAAWTLGTPMLTARRCHGEAALGGKIYVVGGYDNSHYLASVESFDPGVDIWRAVASMSEPRGELAVVANTGHLYGVGGRTDGELPDGNIVSTLERYDPAQNIWEILANMPLAQASLDERDRRVIGGANGRIGRAGRM